MKFLELNIEHLHVIRVKCLHSDISTWTPDQTARWIHHRVDARNLPLPSSFCISGANLTKMTISDFDLIFPMGGDQIHEDVQLWKQGEHYILWILSSDYVHETHSNV